MSTQFYNSETEVDIQRSKMDFSEIFNDAYENYKSVIFWQIALLLVIVTLNISLSYIAQLISGYDSQYASKYMIDNISTGANYFSVILDAPGYTSYFFMSSLFNLLLQPLCISAIYIMHKGKTGQSIAFNDLFIGYKKNTLSYMMLSVATSMILIFSMMLCILPVFFVIPLLYTASAFVLFENKSPLQAINSSFQLAKEHYATVLGVSILSLIISVAGVLLCGVGILMTGMFGLATAYTVYIAKKGVPVLK